jgi:hypothetical protein
MNQMCVKINMTTNEFKKTNSQCDSSIDASCGSDQSQKSSNGKKVGEGMKQAQATQEHISGYVKSLIVSSIAPYVKVSDIDLGNHMQVFYAASQGINDKQLIAAADMAYDVINKKLTAAIKTHMNYIETSYANKNCYYKESDKGKDCLGDLKFNNPTIYLRSMQESHSDSARMISPADKTLAYKFFMIRAVIGDYARKLEPDWVVTFKENGDKSYTSHDVLDTFEYVNAKSEKMTGHNGVKVNRVAGDILKADKVEIDRVVHNVFDEFITDCNKLKVTSSLHHQVTVCQNVNEMGDPDYFLELLTCLEIFNLATTAGFCKELDYEDDFEL